MEFITAIYEASMLLKVAKGTGIADMRVTAFRIGDFSVVGLPGEPFCQIGMDVKAASPYALQFTLGLTNGGQGYFPSKEAFDVNGYEARTSSFQPCVAQMLTEAGINLLKQMED